MSSPTSVNLIDYGAIPNDPSKKAVNSAALLAAQAAGLPIYIPTGKFTIDPTAIYAPAVHIFGQGALAGVLSISGAQKVRVRDITFCSPADMPLQIYNSSDVIVDAVEVQSYDRRGIYINQCNRVRLQNCTITGAGTEHGISLYACSNVSITGCQSVSAAGIFAFSVQNCTNVVAVGNIGANSHREGFNTDTCVRVLAGHNLFAFDQTTSVDYGMSTYSASGVCSDVFYTGNLIDQCGYYGITLATGTIRSSVIGNHIHNPNRRPPYVVGPAIFVQAPAHDNFCAWNFVWADNLTSPVTRAAPGNIVGPNMVRPSNMPLA